MNSGSRILCALAVLMGMALAAPALAAEPAGQEMSAEQKAMMEAWAASMKPGPQQAQLAEGAGTWTVKTTVWMAPGAQPIASEGEAVRAMMLGGRVRREDFKGAFQGQPFVGIGHSGYDNVTGRYWATWMDNMMTGVAVLAGQWNEAKGALVLEGEVPDPMAAGLIPIRMEGRRDGKDREIDDFYKPGPDGTMYRYMQIVYERQ